MRKGIILSALALSLFAANVQGAFAANLPSATVPGNLGVNIHFTNAPQKDLDMIQQAGFKFIRMDVYWVLCEKQKGVYDFAQYDTLMAGLAQRGIRPLLIIGYSNQLYESSLYSVRTDAGRQAYAKFAATLVARYKQYNPIWEIWNEPNHKNLWLPAPNATEYMTLVKAAVPAMRAVDPNATIIAPATSEIDFPFVESCLSQGLLEYVDAVSIHPYRWGAPEPVVNDYATMRALIAKYSPGQPDVPIVSSEWGYTSITSEYSEATQGQYIARSLLLNLSQGVPLSIWYDWKNDGTDLTQRENTFGTVRADYSIKPAYTAVQNLTQSLNGLSFVKRIATSNSADWLLLFSNGTKSVIAAWTTGSSHNVEVTPGITKTLTGDPVYVTTTVAATVPAAPSSLAVDSVTKGATSGYYYVNLSWKDNSTDETGFEIYQSVNSTSNFQLVQSAAANLQAYGINIGATPTAGTYYYKIVAVNQAGKSTESNVVSTVVNDPAPVPVPVPAAPSNLAATVTKGTTGNTLINLSWTDNATNETGFKVLRSASATGGFQEIQSLGSNATSASVDMGVTPTAGTYYFQVTAINASGASQPSNTASAQIVPQVAPAAPSNLAVTSVTKGSRSGNYYVNLGWKDNSTDETGFQILQSINSTDNFKLISSPAVNAQSARINLGSTPTVGKYYYEIVAVNANGKSAPSNIVNTQIGTPVPAIPSGLTANAVKDINGKNDVILNWADNSTDETGFNLYVSNSATGPFTKLGTLSTNQVIVVHPIDTLTVDTTFYYQIKAFNAGGESGVSNTISTIVKP